MSDASLKHLYMFSQSASAVRIQRVGIVLKLLNLESGITSINLNQIEFRVKSKLNSLFASSLIERPFKGPVIRQTKTG